MTRDEIYQQLHLQLRNACNLASWRLKMLERSGRPFAELRTQQQFESKRKIDFARWSARPLARRLRQRREQQEHQQFMHSMPALLRPQA